MTSIRSFTLVDQPRIRAVPRRSCPAALPAPRYGAICRAWLRSVSARHPPVTDPSATSQPGIASKRS